MARCPICQEEVEVASHHIHPICYGGEDNGPQIDLCSVCHNAVHYTAESLTGKVKPHNYFNSEEKLNRARNLIQAIINAKTWFTSQPQSNKPRRRMITLQIGDADWQKLHKAKLDSGFKNMQVYLESLIYKEISKTRYIK